VKNQVLHIGNILNNGYLHCKYLHTRGVNAECLNLDYTHCQGQPEWSEVRIESPVAHWDEDWKSIDLGGFVRPAWYHQVVTAELAALAATLGADVTPVSTGGADGSDGGRVLEPITRGLKSGLRRCRLDGVARRVLGRLRRINPLPNPPADAQTVFARTVIADYDRFYPDAPTRLTTQDVIAHMPRAEALRPILAQFPLIQGYSLDPILALLGSPGRPFLCYEHGTMRDFPFEDSARGRLYALALKKAEKIFITNVDCIGSARRLGLDNWVFIPHLIDDERFKPAVSPERARLLERFNCDHLILCPARHHWKNAPDANPNSWLKGNDVLIHGLGKFFAERPAIRAHVIFFDWGLEVDLSKALIGELGFADRVHWEPIRSKLSMLDLYNAADVVCDQFNPGLASFGATVPEALACAKPIISILNRETHSWGFPILPPVVDGGDAECVQQSLLRLFGSAETRRQIGEEGLAWFREHHSSKLVIDRMISVYAEVAERFGWNWSFN